ncbi:MAG TPA: tail fiber protein [Pseudomonadales bacterium]|nr:tail fiber protein [Pseudomonadales bacterium]
MADAYIGEIRLLPYNFCPEGWLPCNGQQVLIQQYQALYAVVGNLYGASSASQFYLPDLRGRAPMGMSAQYPAGTQQGADSVTLTSAQMPLHTHNVVSNRYVGSSNVPASNLRFGGETDSNFAEYVPAPTPPVNPQPVAMHPATISAVGQGLPHENRQPFLALQFCICATDGEFPVKP